MVRVVGALTPTAILTGRVQGQGSAAFLKTETFSGEPKLEEAGTPERVER